MTEFSLRKLTAEVSDDIGAVDYHVLAKEVLCRIPAGRREAALGEALVEYARQFNSHSRPSLRPGKAGRLNSARSAKVAGIRRVWPQLRATYLTVDGQKPLGDCTRADVLFIAENLERKAQENMAKAGRIRGLADALAEHSANRVRDLPDDVLASFLVERAA